MLLIKDGPVATNTVLSLVANNGECCSAKKVPYSLRLFKLLWKIWNKSSLELASNIVTETECLTGSKKYAERVDQPWFRAPRSEPQRIDEKDVCSFGKHTVPNDDDSATLSYWTPLEEKYLLCLNRRCVCPYFNGSISIDERILLSGELLRRALCQEITSRVHKRAGVRAGSAFTIWHREFLKRFELVVLHFSPNPNMGVPYWDSTLDCELREPLDSLIFTDIFFFFGEVNEDGFVVSPGHYKNNTRAISQDHPWILRGFGLNEHGKLLNKSRVDWIVNNPDINMVFGTSALSSNCTMKNTKDERILEPSHDKVHFFIGGDREEQHSSMNDVIFLFHHSVIDLIFETWRRNNQNRTERKRDYPAGNEKCFPPWHNIDSVMPMLHIPLLSRARRQQNTVWRKFVSAENAPDLKAREFATLASVCEESVIKDQQHIPTGQTVVVADVVLVEDTDASVNDK
uniref:Tyrosinase_Cu-bd domain-containing protein n=1 Tax=Angiostrongylus cantonensis TaxID=6313 RepID=A0A158P974_ANGCA